MRKSVIAVAATPILVFALSSCSSGSSTPTNTTPEAPASQKANAADAAKVDSFCKTADEIVAEAKKLTDEAKAKGGQSATMSSADQEKITAKVTKLTTQAEDLAPIVIADPSLLTQLTKCSENLQKATTGG